MKDRRGGHPKVDCHVQNYNKHKPISREIKKCNEVLRKAETEDGSVYLEIESERRIISREFYRYLATISPMEDTYTYVTFSVTGEGEEGFSFYAHACKS